VLQNIFRETILSVSDVPAYNRGVRRMKEEAVRIDSVRDALREYLK
jgi:hypothetical protein